MTPGAARRSPRDLGALEAVGETKCICRNEYAVHEQVGAFTNQHLNGHAGLVLNPRPGPAPVPQPVGKRFSYQ
jgi:putative hemin transport protein